MTAPVTRRILDHMVTCCVIVSTFLQDSLFFGLSHVSPDLPVSDTSEQTLTSPVRRGPHSCVGDTRGAPPPPLCPPFRGGTETVMIININLQSGSRRVTTDRGFPSRMCTKQTSTLRGGDVMKSPTRFHKRGEEASSNNRMLRWDSSGGGGGAPTTSCSL